MSNSLQSCGPSPAMLLCPRDSPGKNTGVGCRALLQGIFLTQGSNPGLLCLPYHEDPREALTMINIKNFFLMLCQLHPFLKKRKKTISKQYFLFVINIYLLLLFSSSLVPDSLQPHGLQQASLPCPLPSPRACSNSYPFLDGCH